MSEWPGYTPPSTGSSQNCGTPPLSSYVNREAAIKAQYAADGADTSQEPPQYYGNSTAQRRNEPEGHKDAVAPAQPTVATAGSGKARVTWTAPAAPPSVGYVVKASSGQTVGVRPDKLTADFTGLTVAASVTFTVTATNTFTAATSPASASFTVV